MDTQEATPLCFEAPGFWGKTLRRARQQKADGLQLTETHSRIKLGFLKGMAQADHFTWVPEKEAQTLKKAMAPSPSGGLTLLLAHNGRLFLLETRRAMNDSGQTEGVDIPFSDLWGCLDSADRQAHLNARMPAPAETPGMPKPRL